MSRKAQGSRASSDASIRKQLLGASEQQLIAFLDSKSIKIGDTAAGLLASRRSIEAVRRALLQHLVRSTTGKIRALAILRQFGKKATGAIDVYLAYLRDRSVDVVQDALFGLVFWQDAGVIPSIREAMLASAPESETHRLLARAIAALEAENPFIFSPNYWDASDVWGLDKVRFPKGAAPPAPHS